jgi:HEPN domain-containing protein
MRGSESSYAQDWFARAQADMRRVNILLQADDLEDAAFHLQQAIEKYLKGYLLERGWVLERTHNLPALLNEAVRYNENLERFRPLCQRVTEYYLEHRYPIFLTSQLTVEEIITALAQAQDMVQEILNKE